MKATLMHREEWNDFVVTVLSKRFSNWLMGSLPPCVRMLCLQSLQLSQELHQLDSSRPHRLPSTAHGKGEPLQESSQLIFSGYMFVPGHFTADCSEYLGFLLGLRQVTQHAGDVIPDPARGKGKA